MRPTGSVAWAKLEQGGNQYAQCMQPIQRTIGSIKFDQVMTEVLVTMGDLEIVSLISCNSAERMGL